MDRDDLTLLEDMFARSTRVDTMAVLNGYITSGVKPPDAGIFLRHDVDGNNTSLESALAMAQWEARHGYRSTYYFLHHVPYWKIENAWVFKQIADLGHEIGFHNNALAEGRRQKRDPFVIMQIALSELRQWSEQPVRSTASHGDRDCSYGGFINYQLFVEGNASAHVRDNYKSPAELKIVPRPLAEFGLEFQGDWLPRPHYVTDSGGTWGNYDHLDYVHSLPEANRLFPWSDGHLVVLQHPDWWPVGLYA